LRLASLSDDLIYLLSGRRFAFARWRVQDLMNALFAARGVLELYEELAKAEDEAGDETCEVQSKPVAPIGLPPQEEVKAVVTDILEQRRVEDRAPDPVPVPDWTLDTRVSALTHESIRQLHHRGRVEGGAPTWDAGTVDSDGACLDCGRVMYTPPRPWFYRSCSTCDHRRPRDHRTGRLL